MNIKPDTVFRDRVGEMAQKLPYRLWDAHAHLYCQCDLFLQQGGVFSEGPSITDINVWHTSLMEQLGESELAGGLFMPAPFVPVEKISQVNQWILTEVDKHNNSRSLVLVSPDMELPLPDSLLKHNSFAGFKPYHTYSSTKPTFDALPQTFVPEWVWQMADEYSLLITLHLVRAGAMADPDNIAYIRTHCENYPNAKLILAHAGRSFHAPNARSGAQQLSDIDNLWFDTSGVCEVEPLLALLETFGPYKLMWGSDFPVSQQYSRCVSAGTGFLWITPEHVKDVAPECQLLTTGMESLRAHLEAAQIFGLNAEDLDFVFYQNACLLTGVVEPSNNQSQELYRYACTLIPGGTQLLSKRPEMLAPKQWPPYFREARGCKTWDIDGRCYTDFSTNGIGSCLLGFQDSDVSAAVRRRVALGSMCTLNTPDEVELAELLCGLHPWAEQVRFARCGGEACAMAVRIARATTDRSVVAVCGYSGWQDWYLAANLGESDALRGHLLPGLEPLGVPGELRGTTQTFTFNNREQLDAILSEHGDNLAAVVMEPCRSSDPEPGFLEYVRSGVRKAGGLLVFDEITIGWRLALGGAHLKLGIEPDIAIFGKALGNGHPMAAVIGSVAAMSGAHDTFISSTFWTEGVGPAAALATIKKMQMCNVPEHIAHVGELIQAGWRRAADRFGLPLRVSGYPCLSSFAFDHKDANALRTLFTQQMLVRGYLAGTGVYPTLAHNNKIVERYLISVEEVFAEIAEALQAGDVCNRLHGPVAHSGFKRLL